ncbi:MAG: hypothetical protein LUQ65_08045 [Candidatus Helarchaeota archaeon]|nr:hypothetical protein [Candidatus Helarchaeota archaeon]
MDLNFDEFKDLIYMKLVRAQKYLQEYSKELPRYLMVRHRVEHPLSELHILLQQLSNYSNIEAESLLRPSKIGIAADLSFLDLALNEIRTILNFLTEKKREAIFPELRNEDLEQKLIQITQSLEEIRKNIK